MANSQPITGFFSSEWQRFNEGLQGLDPRVLEAVRFLDGVRGRSPDEPTTITIPGWNQVIKLGPRLEVAPEQWAEFYKAQRQKRPPNLPDNVLNEIAWMQLVREANRTSAQPAWSKNFGQIMTAIDNVQDFMSTLATLGRLALWAGSRIGLRAIPGLGMVILASDLLNLMNFIGMIAMPAYGLLCDGPRAALAAGVPAAILKNALCREVWTMAKMNPFGRQARAARKLKALGKLPGIGNLIEVAQTTDNLFGVGLSIGALYGMALEAVFASSGGFVGQSTTINTKLLEHSVGLGTRGRFQTLTGGQQQLVGQAGKVLVGATAIASQSDMFPDWMHQAHLAALLGAVPVAHEFLNHPDTAEWLPDFLAQSFPAPEEIGRTARAFFDNGDDADAGIGRWWIPGQPTHATGEELVLALAPLVTRAVSDFIIPRRERADSLFYGAALGQLVENLWYTIEPDPEALRWELAPDMKLMTGLAVDGLLIPGNTDEGAAWRLWQSMRRELDRRGGKLLDAPKVRELARAAAVPLMQLLPPDAPYPIEWRAFFESGGADRSEPAGYCPTCGAPHG